jgi:DNA modification methylase
VICGLSDAEQRALALADNKIAANSGWDRAVVAAELGELATLLPECDLDLEITGFEPAEVDALVADFGGSERDPADEIPTIEPIAVSRPDDVWALGDHRLVCGDAANDIHAGALMGRERAAMVFADPPYNLQVASVVGRGKIKHLEFASASGEMSRDEFTIFLKNTFSLAGHYSREGSVHYVCIDWRHLTEILAAGEEIYELKNLVVWVKTNAGQGSFYRSQHELIMVFKNGDGPHQNNIELGRHGRSRSNVWTYGGVNSFRAGRLDELSIHPTVKPVALVADAMRDCSRRGDIVLDPSGVTGSWSWPMAFPMMAEPFQAFLKSPSRSLGPSGMGLASLGCGFLQQSRKDVEQPMSAEIRKILRCAIYTRKSTEHGLELEFNSLDAQRDACEA